MGRTSDQAGGDGVVMKRLRIVGIVIGVIAVGWFISHALGRREPQYQGRALTQWLDDLLRLENRDWLERGDLEQHPTWLATKDALNYMGKDALPFVLDDLVATPSRTTRVLASAASHKAIAAVLKKKWADEIEASLEEERLRTSNRHLRALCAFRAMGSNARSAEPTIVKLTEHEDHIMRLRAFNALQSMNPEKEVFMPVAKRLLSDRDRDIQYFSAACIRRLYPDELEAAGVYKLFPTMRAETTNSAREPH
jgi:hypothetical protein